MTLFKDRQTAAPVTREEFDALRDELAALRRVAAIGFMAVEEAAKYTGVHGGPGSAHLRMEKIAAVASDKFGLCDAEVEELRGFLRLVEQARSAEFDRERQETIDRAYAPTWRPDGTYGRRIPGT